MASRHKLFAASLLFTLFATAPCASQQVPPFTPGMRLRVTVATPPMHTQVARFESLNNATLTLSSDAEPRVIPLANISRIEWSEGRQLSITGGVVGLLLGVAAGGVAGCAANRGSYGVFCGGQSDTKVAIGATLGGLTGAALGAFLFRREQWNDVDPSRLR